MPGLFIDREFVHATLTPPAGSPRAAALRKHTHVLCILPPAKALSRAWPGGDVLALLLSRRRMRAGELAKSAVSGNLRDGTLASWMMLDATKSTFEAQAAVRSALQPLLAENPAELAIVVVGDGAQRERAAQLAVYCGWVNGAPLPERKKKSARRRLAAIQLYGHRDKEEFAALRAQAEGNLLCRELTQLPPNELTPTAYRSRIKRLARQQDRRRQAMLARRRGRSHSGYAFS